VDGDDGVPQVLRHVLEALVPQDPGVVDDDVDAAEGVEGRLDHGVGALRRGDAVRVGHRRTAERLDLLDHLLGRPGRGPGAVDGAPQVVDHDLGAPRGQQEGVLPSQTAAGAGDDRHLALEPDLRHASSSRCIYQAPGYVPVTPR
jgi:hypothetical protein